MSSLPFLSGQDYFAMEGDGGVGFREVLHFLSIGIGRPRARNDNINCCGQEPWTHTV